jgi:hypothetical protein
MYRIVWSWPLRIAVIALALLSVAFGVLGVVGFQAASLAAQSSDGTTTATVLQAGPSGSGLAASASDISAPLPGSHGAKLPALPAATDGYLRVLNAGPDAPNISVTIDNNQFQSSLPYATITNYTELSAGSHTVVIATALLPPTTLGRITVNIGSGQMYSLAMYGLWRAQNSANGLRFKVFTDVNTVVRGIARQRTANLIVNAAATDTFADRNASGWTKRFINVGYGGVTGYLRLLPGSYQYALAISPASTVSRAYYTSPTNTLGTFTANTIWQIGGQAPGPNGTPIGRTVSVLVTLDMQGENGNG